MPDNNDPATRAMTNIGLGHFAAYQAGYRHAWDMLHIRPNRLAEVNHTVDILMKGKAIYKDIEAETGVPWWFIGGCHYREGSFSFQTYLGNGQSIHHRTTIVPAGRGPWSTFKAGACDALKIQGFCNCVDWSIERTSYRFEGFNGFGYHLWSCRKLGGTVPSPYLYGGTTAYGPPESCAGKYTRDRHFDASFNDTQLGTMALLKRITEIDQTVAFAPPATLIGEPDDLLVPGVRFVQRELNARPGKIHDLLAEDGHLRTQTMQVLASYQHRIGLPPTGLPDSKTVEMLSQERHKAAPGVMMLGAHAPISEETKELMGSLYDE